MNKIKLFLVFAIGFMFAMSAWAQTDESRMKEILDDEMAIEESGVYTLRFFDAVTGNPVEGGVVDVDHLAKFTTDMSGKVTFDATTPDGAYVAKFTKNGYITANYNFEILAGTIMYNRFSVCPSLKFGEMRVVLEWGKRPKDLDAHLVKQGGYHISFRDMAVAQDGSARLDRDDTNGEGPETITILKVDPKASYTFFVHDFSNGSSVKSKQLSESGAVVRVYGDNKLMNNFYIKADQKGTKWLVFELKNGVVKEWNRIE